MESGWGDAPLRRGRGCERELLQACDRTLGYSGSREEEEKKDKNEKITRTGNPPKNRCQNHIFTHREKMVRLLR
jgi:hypothetical protein